MTDAITGPRALITAAIGILPWMASGLIALHNHLSKGKTMIDPTPPAVPASPAPVAGPAPLPPAGGVDAPVTPTLGDLAAQLRAATEEFRDARSAAAQARLALTAAEEGKADALATLTAAQDAFGKASAALMGDASGALALDATPVEG
ncbi:hypothetical protein [Nitrospirillum sp. BR 11163]|uniref:hypothetical protein n=1 Tax=Nitrospirillum sp. BR 11163 TaxID=3104323 RepID=UPI002AFE7E05|nr:hypothetical protein [Nitrospirillum sp. BR 11163]MEA1674119.1 hypothetical protein [Nitrospirillum sp. BR 11163]